MKHFSDIPTTHSDCPPLFRWFYFGKWHLDFLCIQDAVHMAFRALITKLLRIGDGIASKSSLIVLTKEFPKMIIGISENQLTDNKDSMNFEIAEKVCSERVIEKLTRPEELATKAYLQWMRHIIIAYIEPSTNPTERLFSAWYVALFCRLWKEDLVSSHRSQSRRINSQDNSLATSVAESFISSNLHTCCEINGHHLLRLHNRCRDLNKPEIFLPSLTGSQPSESKFRTYRSMTTTRSTVISFDIMDMCQRSRRLRVLETIKATTVNFTFKTKKQEDIFVPEVLMSDEEVNEIIKHGLDGAEKTLTVFSK